MIEHTFDILDPMELADAVTATSVAVDRVRAVCVDHCDVSVLRAELARLKLVQSRFDAQIARLTHAADAAGAFIGTGARDTAEWLSKQTGTSARRNRGAAQLGEAMASSDELADAVTSGGLSTDQAAAAVGAAGGAALSGEIIEAIADLPLPAVKPAVEEWRARTNPDRDADLADVQRARRHLTLTDQADGMTRVDGLLDPESGAIVRSALDGIMNHTAFDGTNRTRVQRCADAFTQLCAAASKGEIRGGRSNTKLIATVPFDTIVERAAERGVTHVGPTLDPATVRKLACDAGIHRMITGPGSSILDFGHENRLVSDNLFIALVGRDQRCRWPGCSIRATWCDAHHIIHRSDHGATNDENLVLLCHRHHQLSHQPGWQITGTGAALHVHHPDGTIEVSKPPGATPPRAGETGREPPADHASTPADAPRWATAPRTAHAHVTSGPTAARTAVEAVEHEQHQNEPVRRRHDRLMRPTRIVREGGLEPPRGCPHWHLKPARLPFRHSREWRQNGSGLQPRSPLRDHRRRPGTASTWRNDRPRKARPSILAVHMGLQSLERRLERMVEGVFSRRTRGSIRPIELGRRLVREMDDNRSVDVKGRRIVPNDFTVMLSASDHDRFQRHRGRAHHRTRRGRPRVRPRGGLPLHGPGHRSTAVDNDLKIGRFGIARQLKQAPGGIGAGSLVLPSGAACRPRRGRHHGRPPPRVHDLDQRHQRQPQPRRGPHRLARLRRRSTSARPTARWSTAHDRRRASAGRRRHHQLRLHPRSLRGVLTSTSRTTVRTNLGRTLEQPMTDQVLNILKFVLLGLLYLFFARVLWAVWSEVRTPKQRPIDRPVQHAATPRRAPVPRRPASGTAARQRRPHRRAVAAASAVSSSSNPAARRGTDLRNDGRDHPRTRSGAARSRSTTTRSSRSSTSGSTTTTASRWSKTSARPTARSTTATRSPAPSCSIRATASRSAPP